MWLYARWGWHIEPDWQNSVAGIHGSWELLEVQCIACAFLSSISFPHQIPTFRISCVMYTPKAKKIVAMLCTNSLYFLVFVIYAFHVKHILMRKCCYMWLPRGSTTCWDLRVQITIILKLWIEIDNLIHAQSNIQKLK